MAPSRYVVDFPTLWVAIDWVEAHCVIPDRFAKGDPFLLTDWQIWFYANYYRVKPDAPMPTRERPAIGLAAFHYRRAQIVMPQKALALDTPVATPTGWAALGEVGIGDTVFAGDGSPTTVRAVSPIFHDDTYRVTFSDHSSLVACGDHEWLVDRRKGKGYALGERWSTREMLEHGLVDGAGARRFRVGVHPGIETPEADLPIPAYTLGAWLGDGGSHDGRITGIDEGVYTRIELDGFEVRQDRTIAKRRTVIGLAGRLRRAGLLRNKHIPEIYLRASAKQRWALLQGLMDTDGHAMLRAGKCEFTTVTPALRDGMQELLASLGIKAVTFQGVARLNGRETGPKWRITFSARIDMPVFGLDRKQQRLGSGVAHAQFKHRRIVAIDAVDPVPTRCITVDHPSHTFLAGRQMIVTGNSGKGPLTASQICLEGVGPTMFVGWSTGEEFYRCADHGCPCGWERRYDVGEPMAVPRPTALIQITAFSAEQVGNIYDALRPMIDSGPLTEVIPHTGEAFTRLPDGGRIDVVTSSQQSRLGQRVTFVPQDEVGIWVERNKMATVAVTQRRGASAMDGRVVETTNAWDPSENSVGQRTAKAALRRDDIFRLHPLAPPGLSFTNKAERRRIFRLVYEGCPWIDLDNIESEASEIILEDPANAERFYGNRVVAGLGAWITDAQWQAGERIRTVESGTPVAVGFDGSENEDWTAIRCETKDGFRFTPTYGPDRRPTFWNPAEWGGTIPRGEVNAAMDEIGRYYRLRRVYADPRDWRSEIGDWMLKFGEEVVFEWDTYAVSRMYPALVRSRIDLIEARSTHDTCKVTAEHIGNARKVAQTKDRYILGKPEKHQKIDLAMADALAHEAAADLTTAAAWGQPSRLSRARGKASAY